MAHGHIKAEELRAAEVAFDRLGIETTRTYQGMRAKRSLYLNGHVLVVSASSRTVQVH